MNSLELYKKLQDLALQLDTQDPILDAIYELIDKIYYNLSEQELTELDEELNNFS